MPKIELQREDVSRYGYGGNDGHVSVVTGRVLKSCIIAAIVVLLTGTIVWFLYRLAIASLSLGG